MRVAPLLPDSLPAWTIPHRFQSSDEARRDPLRAQVTLDAIADGLFRGVGDGPGLTSITDHLAYLGFHGWARHLTTSFSGDRGKAAYDRLGWLMGWFNLQSHRLIARHEQGTSGRFVVYGVNRLKEMRPLSRGRVPLPARWSTGPSPLVVLDTWARYDGLWEALPPEVRDKAISAWAGAGKPAAVLRLARGEVGEFLPENWHKRFFSLKRLKPLGHLAKYLKNVRLSFDGIGHGLREMRLGQVLDALTRGGSMPSVDEWTANYLCVRGGAGDPVDERFRRAALGRAIIYSANREFYMWARETLSLDPLPVGPLDRDSPTATIRVVERALSRSAREALHEIDALSRRPESQFSLLGAVKAARGTGFQAWVLECAESSGKSFIDRTGSSSWEVVDPDRIREFTGSFAGGLRLMSTWRFGMDIRDALR